MAKDILATIKKKWTWESYNVHGSESRCIKRVTERQQRNCQEAKANGESDGKIKLEHLPITIKYIDI